MHKCILLDRIYFSAPSVRYNMTLVIPAPYFRNSDLLLHSNQAPEILIMCMSLDCYSFVSGIQ